MEQHSINQKEPFEGSYLNGYQATGTICNNDRVLKPYSNNKKYKGKVEETAK